MLSRRRFLTASAALAGLAGAPRLVRAATSGDGFTVLRAKGGNAPLLGEQGDPTAIWGYNGQSPGPTLRVRQGEDLKVRLVNRLLEPTSIHWHGIRLPNAMDGTALTQEPVAPGDSFDYVFAPPDAGTFWYHAHVRASEQVARGLYGALIVEEEAAAQGSQAMSDVLMVIDDWWLFDSGAINDDTFGDLMVASHGGRMGNWLTVNGASRPTITAPAGERLRLRLLNAANARVMRLQFDGADPHLLAIDGQPLPAPRQLGSQALVLPPGGRADVGVRRGPERVVVAVDINGERLELAFIERKNEPELEAEAVDEAEAPDEAEGENPEGARSEVTPKVVSVAATEEESAPEPEPAPEPELEAEPDTAEFVALPANPLPATLDVAAALPVSVVMEGGAMGSMTGAALDGEYLTVQELVGHGMTWAMNGTAGMAEDPLVEVERGRTVAITIDNKTAWAHALHLHGHHVRILEENGRNVEDPLWRDTVLIEPQGVVAFAFRADNPGSWMLQCHVLEHGEAGMMTWIEVT